MNNDPLISVIMASYNSSAFLEEAVASLQSQTIHDWELIAIDDASQDESPEMIQAMAKNDPRIGLLRMPQNSGAGAARDFAIRHAHGEFIAIFDADDVCMPDRFEKQVAFLKAHPEIIAVGTQTVQVDVEGKPFGAKTFPTDPEALYRMMYTAVPIQLPSLMVNTKLLPPNFTWFEGWRCSEDSLLFFKLACYGKIANLPDFLLKYRYHPQSISFRMAKVSFFKTWKARRIARRHYHYKPSIRARLISGLQLVVITCLPGRCIPFVYKTVRRLMLFLSGHKAL